MTSSVLIIGSMAFDDLELPSGVFSDVVGGAATYAALAVSRSARARIVAVVGEDFPEAVLDDLGDRGIDTAGVERKKGKTFRWAGRYSSDLASRTTLDTQLNVFGEFRPRLPPSYRDSEFVLLANIHPALQLEVLDQVVRPRFVAADTMNFWIERERPTLLEVLRRVDTLVINDEELRQLAGEHSIRQAARTVRAMGPRRLVCKRGEFGAILFDDHGTFFAPPFLLEASIDPTGAGDTFAGALLGALASAPEFDAASLRRALLVAAATASFTVEGVGTHRLAEVTASEIAARSAEIERSLRTTL
ncbi:MAG: sugar kinase [Polyangiaceae bacterium]|nr:sugar kinase [Polyangiaceae bacterium]